MYSSSCQFPQCEHIAYSTGTQIFDQYFGEKFVGLKKTLLQEYGSLFFIVDSITYYKSSLPLLHLNRKEPIAMFLLIQEYSN